MCSESRNTLSPEVEACPICGQESILLKEMGSIPNRKPLPEGAIYSEVLWLVASQVCECSYRFSGLKSVVEQSSAGNFRMVTEWAGVNPESESVG